MKRRVRPGVHRGANQETLELAGEEVQLFSNYVPGDRPTLDHEVRGVT
jgi:hypothetical protein